MDRLAGVHYRGWPPDGTSEAARADKSGFQRRKVSLDRRQPKGTPEHRFPATVAPIRRPAPATCSRGEYNNPVRIVAFNTSEGWSRDVTVDIADEVRRRYVEFDDVPESVLAFLEASNRR
jgi:hypothetical protein